MWTCEQCSHNTACRIACYQCGAHPPRDVYERAVAAHAAVKQKEQDAEEEEQGVDGPDFGGWASAVTQEGLRQWAEHELGTFADMVVLDTQQFGSITPVVAPFCAGTMVSG